MVQSINSYFITHHSALITAFLPSSLFSVSIVLRESYPHGELPAVVAVVVVVDEQYQTTIYGRGERLVATDEERLRRLPVRQSYVTNERSDASVGYRISSEDCACTCATAVRRYSPGPSSGH